MRETLSKLFRILVWTLCRHKSFGQSDIRSNIHRKNRLFRHFSLCTDHFGWSFAFSNSIENDLSAVGITISNVSFNCSHAVYLRNKLNGHRMIVYDPLLCTLVSYFDKLNISSWNIFKKSFLKYIFNLCIARCRFSQLLMERVNYI